MILGSWNSLVPHSPEAIDLIGWSNGFLNTQLHHWVASNIFWGWDKVLLKDYLCSESVFIYGVISHITRIHESRNWRAEIRVGPFIINPSDPLAKFLFLVSMTLCCAGLEVLFSEGGMLSPGDTKIIPWEGDWNISGFLLVLSCLRIKVNRKLQQLDY